MENLRIEPIWSDSMGAKSMSTFVETPDTKLIIDPGAAIMQPSFPFPSEMKMRWLMLARAEVCRASKNADIVVITHYHYDHFVDFDPDLYRGKLILTKNPNEYINLSQRRRAESFLDKICLEFGNINLSSILEEGGGEKNYADPINELPLSTAIDLGTYNERRRKILEKGSERFKRLADLWNNLPKIPEIKFNDIEVRFPEEREFNLNKTRIRFTKPMFHGIEYSQVGWVFSVIIEYKHEKFLYSSDLSGPVIEDYAKFIIDENPNFLIIDGPPTYLFPYMFNMINLNRSISNLCDMIENLDSEVIILDHHLLRDRRYKEILSDVYETADKKDKNLLTFAEYLGRKPVLLR
ncbi:MAG: MBL fold metallo-hydrolase [Candidatus Altiarchaeales archaeon]|nr:MAG: MBL fold metallo-hydrolase [Candidatus Altiarchaeales archaeon]RLI94798.1 MAG: MBL fold metallo-hydrolase [Candidatus Altiarchaeales archaeon]HDO82410.1 MBL fold metallo-hydrolase [Candidatus Altiarchaeales archaeon]HEX55059.1 MBL fold metallo-hydrolase [Candidatus Altiarchaeales archaeon]